MPKQKSLISIQIQELINRFNAIDLSEIMMTNCFIRIVDQVQCSRDRITYILLIKIQSKVTLFEW